MLLSRGVPSGFKYLYKVVRYTPKVSQTSPMGVSLSHMSFEASAIFSSIARLRPPCGRKPGHRALPDQILLELRHRAEDVEH